MKNIFLLLLLICAVNSYSFSQCSSPYVGEDFSVCGYWANLNVSNYTTGIWSAYIDGEPLLNCVFLPNNTSTDINVTIPTYESHHISVDFVWTDASGPCSDTVNVIFAKQISSSVGANDVAEICGNEFTFNADTTANGWGTDMFWTSPIMPANFGNDSLPNTTVTIDENSYGDSAYVTLPFVWNTHNYACQSTDTMWITFYQRPLAFAGIDNAFCGMNGELGAVFSLPENSNYTPAGWWTLNSAPYPYANANITPANSDTANISVTHPGVYEIVFIDNNSIFPSCYSTDTVLIEFIEIPQIFAGDDFDVCGNCFTTAVISGGYNGMWLANGCEFEDITNSETNVCCTSYGPITLTRQETSLSTTTFLACFAEDDVTVTLWQHPTANITVGTSDTTVYGLTFNNLTAQYSGAGMTGYWYQNNPATEFGDQMSNNTWTTVPYFGTYNFYWIEINGPSSISELCTDEAGPLTIHFLNPDSSISDDFKTNDRVQVFPNPVKDIISIQTDFVIAEICIYDINGRLVLKPTTNSTIIDVSNLETGIYFIKTYSADSQFINKFVKN